MTDLYAEEYQTLRTEVQTSMTELNALESGALLVAAAIFTWLVTHKAEGIVGLGWFIPAALVIFCILRAWSIALHLGWLAEYLKDHEVAHIQPKLRGWEHFLSETASGSVKPRRGVRGKVTGIFWVILLAATLAGGVLGFTAHPVASQVKSASSSPVSATLAP